MARMRRGFPGNLGRDLRDIDFPQPWAKALSSAFAPSDIGAAAAFSWSDPAGGGEGFLLHCRRSRHLFLVNFYHVAPQSAPADRVRILASIRYGAEAGRVLYEIFGIRAAVPDVLGLKGHRFFPGAFEMRFGAKREAVRYCRWGPASVLLREEPLLSFAARQFDISPEKVFPERDSPDASVAWTDGRTVHPLARLLARPLFRRGRAWRIADQNKILAVQVTAASPPSEDCLADLCRRFRSMAPGAPA